jgi:hypothetical protein
MVFKTISCFLGLHFNLYVCHRYCKKVAFFGQRAALLCTKVSGGYPIASANYSRGESMPLALDHRVLASL